MEKSAIWYNENSLIQKNNLQDKTVRGKYSSKNKDMLCILIFLLRRRWVLDQNKKNIPVTEYVSEWVMEKQYLIGYEKLNPNPNSDPIFKKRIQICHDNLKNFFLPQY